MELKIVEWVAQNLHHPVLDRIMVWITHLGDNGYLWVAVCLLLLCYKPTRKWGGVMALSLLLCAARRVAEGDRMVRGGRWPRLTGTSLKGKTIGIVGTGVIGRTLTAYLAGFHMTILGYDMFPNAEFENLGG